MKKHTIALALTGLFVSNAVYSQETNYRPLVNSDLPVESTDGFLTDSGVRIYSNFTFSVGRTDNPGAAPDASTDPADRKRDATVTSLSGDVSAVFGNPAGQTQGRLGVSLSSQDFSGGSVDDNTSVVYSGDLRISPTDRFDAKASLSYTDGEDPKGAVNDNRTVNSFSVTTYGVSLGFGAPGAIGRLEFDVSQSDKSYDKDGATFAGLTAQDVERTSYTGRFLYRLAPKTRAFVEGSFVDNKYDGDLLAGNTENLDSEDTRISVGLKWDATAKTSGSLNVGSISRDYDTENAAVKRENNSSTFWDIAVVWNPTQSDTVTLTTGSTIQDSFNNFGQQEADRYSIAWSKNWIDRVSTTLSYSLVEDSFDGYQTAPGVIRNRKDSTDSFSLSASYQMRAWLNLGLRATYEERDSNLKGTTSQDNFNYDRTTYGATASVVF